MPRNLGPAPVAALGLTDTTSTPADTITRNRLAVTHPSMDIEYSDALDLEATVLVSMSAELTGASAKLAGPLHPNKFREMLRGERPFNLAHLCRMAVSLHPKAKAAARAAARFILARAAARSRSVEVREAAVTMMGNANAAGFEAIRTDGKLTTQDAIAIIARIETARAGLDDLEAAVLAAIGGRRI